MARGCGAQDGRRPINRLATMLGIFQSDIDTYNEQMGQTIGWIVGAVLLILAVVWLIKRSRKG